jgi:hypothetical protein
MIIFVEVCELRFLAIKEYFDVKRLFILMVYINAFKSSRLSGHLLGMLYSVQPAVSK